MDLEHSVYSLTYLCYMTTVKSCFTVQWSWTRLGRGLRGLLIGYLHCTYIYRVIFKEKHSEDVHYATRPCPSNTSLHLPGGHLLHPLTACQVVRSANQQTSLATQSSAQPPPGSLDREAGLDCRHVAQVGQRVHRVFQIHDSVSFRCLKTKSVFKKDICFKTSSHLYRNWIIVLKNSYFKNVFCFVVFIKIVFLPFVLKQAHISSHNCYLLAAVIAHSFELNVDRRSVVGSHLVRANTADTRPRVGRIGIERHRFESGRIIWSNRAGDNIQQRRIGLRYAEHRLSTDHCRSNIEGTWRTVRDPVSINRYQLFHAFEELGCVESWQGRPVGRSKHSADNRPQCTHNEKRPVEFIPPQSQTFTEDLPVIYLCRHLMSWLRVR